MVTFKNFKTFKGKKRQNTLKKNVKPLKILRLKKYIYYINILWGRYTCVCIGVALELATHKYTCTPKCRGERKKKGKKKMKKLINKIEEWAIERNLQTAKPKDQALKLMEEVGELADGLNKNNQEKIIDSIGDIVVVLTIMCKQLDTDITSCVASAYEEIKDRKGKLIDGVWVKEQDLK